VDAASTQLNKDGWLICIISVFVFLFYLFMSCPMLFGVSSIHFHVFYFMSSIKCTTILSNQ
jgi:hypothetical protein